LRVFIVVTVAVLSAPAARAACAVPDGFDVSFPFEGQRVPLNAELRVFGFVRDETFDLTFPDGATQPVAVVQDDLGPRLDVDGPLQVGAYALAVAGGELTVGFEVVEEVDEEAPNTPTATAARSTHFIPPDLLGLGDDCASPGIYDAVAFEVEGADVGDLVMLDDRIATFAEAAGRVSTGTREDRGGTVAYEIRLRDFAGNQSDAKTVEMWSGCPGGCASTGALPPLWIALLLLSMRARRTG
jgi:hypothetical protein